MAREIWTEHYIAIIGPDQVAYMLEQFQSREAIEPRSRQGALYFLMRESDESIGYLAVDPKEAELFLSKFM